MPVIFKHHWRVRACLGGCVQAETFFGSQPSFFKSLVVKTDLFAALGATTPCVISLS